MGKINNYFCIFTFSLDCNKEGQNFFDLNSVFDFAYFYRTCAVSHAKLIISEIWCLSRLWSLKISKNL